MSRFDADGFSWRQVRLWPFRRWLTVCVELRRAPEPRPRLWVSSMKCSIAGCERHTTWIYGQSCLHSLCKMHENGPCARCRQLAGETIPLTTEAFPVKRVMAANAEQEALQLQRLCAEAFEHDRFVLLLVDVAGAVQAKFTPTYAEARLFARMYLVPFAMGSHGAYQHNSWRSPLPSEMESDKRGICWTRYARWGDVASIQILTETDDQRLKLDEIIREECGRARA